MEVSNRKSYDMETEKELMTIGQLVEDLGRNVAEYYMGRNLHIPDNNLFVNTLLRL